MWMIFVWMLQNKLKLTLPQSSLSFIFKITLLPQSLVQSQNANADNSSSLSDYHNLVPQPLHN